MSEPQDNVLDKLDALLKKHAVNEPEIPVLTDLVAAPQLDLEAIPVLTEEINTPSMPGAAEIELELVPDPEPATSPSAPASPTKPHHGGSVQVPPPAPKPMHVRPPAGHSAQFRIEIPPNTPYITLSEAPAKVAPAPVPAAAASPPPPPSAPISSPPAAPANQAAATLLDEASLQRIASLVEADLSRQLQESLRQALSKELQGMLHVSLDKVLSSLLDQHMMMIDETVRTAVADEIQKQLTTSRMPPEKNT